jgi:hypothetical protein
MVSKSNFLIALAPYFFPFYAVLVVILFLGARLVISWAQLEVWFLLLLGAAYAFHITLTGHILKTHQSDLSGHGYLFSAVVIFLGNIGVLMLAIPILTGTPPLPTALQWCWEDTVHLIRSIPGWIH